MINNKKSIVHDRAKILYHGKKLSKILNKDNKKNDILINIGRGTYKTLSYSTLKRLENIERIEITLSLRSINTCNDQTSNIYKQKVQIEKLDELLRYIILGKREEMGFIEGLNYFTSNISYNVKIFKIFFTDGKKKKMKQYDFIKKYFKDEKFL